MTLKTAKAAYHTLSMLSAPDFYKDFKYYNTQGMVDLLKNNNSGINFDVLGLNKWSGEIAAKVWRPKKMQDYVTERTAFLIAYGAPKVDKKRETKVKDNKWFTRIAGVSYIQPFITGMSYVDGTKVRETITTYDRSCYGTDRNKLIILQNSATDSFDESFIKTFRSKYSGCSLWGEDFCYPIKIDTGLAEGENKDDYKWDEAKWVYDYRNFLHTVTDNKLAYKHPYKTYAMWSPEYRFRRDQFNHIIFSPQLEIKDNHDYFVLTNARNPLSGKYEVIVHYEGEKGENGYDWWKSLDSTVRYVDAELVEWNKENK